MKRGARWRPVRLESAWIPSKSCGRTYFVAESFEVVAAASVFDFLL